MKCDLAIIIIAILLLSMYSFNKQSKTLYTNRVQLSEFTPMYMVSSYGQTEEASFDDEDLERLV